MWESGPGSVTLVTFSNSLKVVCVCVCVCACVRLPCEGMVSSEQQGVVDWVLYPLEHCMESLLDLWASSWRPRDRARASSSWASSAPAWRMQGDTRYTPLTGICTGLRIQCHYYTDDLAVELAYR